ncbi:MAG: hypothetical protein KatS3mg022_2263 [Armatimonadota bacterium]|nr:MAG: hypothetical protein KatS3mg022_2263 [Armatimonadota bacterium]
MPRVIIEETIATCEPPNNGSGPLWCWGAPLLIRAGDEVYASVMETGAGVPPLCNTRPRLYRKRRHDGWQMVWAPPAFREREPCPLVTLPQGKLFLSVNASVMPPGTQYGKCEPRLLEFSRSVLSEPRDHIPPFPQTATFTDHSYRGIAADSQRGEILLLHIDARTSEYHYALLKSDGQWDAPGILSFPIRACYPQVALRNRAAYVLAIGDIVEPVEEWRRYKRERTQREWDYVFRRLFFTWTPNVLSEPFCSPIEVDNVDATGGHIINLDLWLDSRGIAHLLYLRQQTTSLLRDKYFPNLPLRATLQHCTVKEGHIVLRQTLMEGGEGVNAPYPLYARLHSPDGEQLLAVYAASRADGTRFNALFPLLPQRGESQTIPLREPFSVFFTACERGGSKPSRTVDLFGIAQEPTVLRYACVQL